MTVRPSASKKATSTKSIRTQNTRREIHFSMAIPSARSSPSSQAASLLSISVRLSTRRTTIAISSATSHPTTRMATAARIAGPRAMAKSTSELSISCMVPLPDVMNVFLAFHSTTATATRCASAGQNPVKAETRPTARVLR